VAHSRDHKGVGIAHEIVSPKKPASTFPDDGAILLGKTKPNKLVYKKTRGIFN